MALLYSSRFAISHFEGHLNIGIGAARADYRDPLNNNLEIWLPMNEGGGTLLHDISNLGRWGRFDPVRLPKWSARGNLSIVDFDGTDDRAEFPKELLSDNGAWQEITVSAWVKNDIGAGAGTDDIVSKWHYTSDRMWVLTHHSNDQYFWEVQGVGSITGGTVSTNWTHVAAVFSNADDFLGLYVNGALVASNTSATGNMASNNADIFIGGQSNTGSNTFDGAIRDLRIWRRRLGAHEIKHLYDDPLAGYASPFGQVWIPISASGATVAVTGVASTSGIGTIGATGAAQFALSGVASAAAIGTATATGAAVISLTGVASTSGIGTATATGAASVSITGVSSAAAVGILSALGAANISLTGVSGTGEIGTAAATGAANTALTGVSATGEIGTSAALGSALVTLAGLAATGQIGTVVVLTPGGETVILAGVAATGAIGTPTVTGAAQLTLAGVESTAALGTLTALGASNVALSGVAATGEIGTATATGAALVQLAGLAATGQIGSITIVTPGGVTLTLTGVAGTGQIGTLTGQGAALLTLPGVAATGAAGDVEALVHMLVQIAGVSSTAAVGVMSQVTGALLTLQGVAATGGIGTVSIPLPADQAGELLGTITITAALGSDQTQAITITPALLGSAKLH